ncbi:hypothetical protein GNIT_3491 [Glaciecola nitratireducens FR1064]|uniref:Uncharacterized protein n=1 Tax=Glaciecola nitratireducens (strain JCM 12485 / KCTC 12276 / FR1064) TaxID=1085623 RepID=G4QNM7_GLANF|nr:hypothetical protein GNIT_3491 [Glaciecola nitratireducens FR1064]
MLKNLQRMGRYYGISSETTMLSPFCNTNLSINDWFY